MVSSQSDTLSSFYSLFYSIKPFLHQSFKELALLNLQIMSCSIQHRERRARIVFQDVPGVAIANDLILPSSKKQYRLLKRLRECIDIKRKTIPLCYFFQKSLVGNDDTGKDLIPGALPDVLILYHCEGCKFFGFVRGERRE